MTLHRVTSISFSVNERAGRHDPAPEFLDSVWRMTPQNPSASCCSRCAFRTKTCRQPLLLLGGKSPWLMKNCFRGRGGGSGGCR